MNYKKLLWSVIGLLAFTFLFSCSKEKTPDEPTISDITINEIRPTHGPLNTTDTLIGKGFDRIQDIDSVLLNGKRLTLISRSPEQVIVRIPAMAGTGNIDIGYQGKVVRGPVFNYDSTVVVTTLAGSSTESGVLDGTGQEARFNNPQGIAVDASGNVYVADRGNNSIRKVTPQGQVTTLAGPMSKAPGYVDGTGKAARFTYPCGLAIDAGGFLYVGDYANQRIRKVSNAGMVTTLAGVTWDADPRDGQLDGDPSVATFIAPAGVTTDTHNNVYVADISNNAIRKVTPTGNVSTFAGGDYYHYGHQDGLGRAALFFTPYVVASDPSDNIYVIDGESHYIRKITPEGIVTTILGVVEPDITGTENLFSAYALAADRFGNLFFAIRGGIFKRTPDGKISRYAAGGIGELDGPAQIATYRAIAGIAIDTAGNLYITDNNRVRKITWQ